MTPMTPTRATSASLPISRALRRLLLISLPVLALGVIIGMGLAEAFPGLSKDASSFQYALVFGLCNAVPALPILAVVLNELKINSVRLGNVTLAAAGVGDALLWASIAVILPFAPDPGSAGGSWVPAAAIAFTRFVASYLFCTRLMSPLLLRLRNSGAPERVTMILVGFTIFGSASITAVLPHPRSP